MNIDDIELKDSERTKCEIRTRIIGYYRSIDSFNIGKKGEVEERKYFSQEVCKNRIKQNAS